jgi:predicted enzyme related to lactoylglutathione lyase
MMRQVHYTPGRFVWHELVTSDVESARRFYGELLGWQVERVCEGDRAYNYLTQNGQRIGGILLRPGPHVPSHVLGYVSVLDFEGTLARAREHRAAVLVPPADTPIGRTAVLQDPQGATFGLCRAQDGDMPATTPLSSGAFCWDQLDSSDAERAAAFYGTVLRWVRAPSSGDASLSAFTQGEIAVAGLRQAPQGTFANWLVCVSVNDLHSARARARELGATIMIETIVHAGMGELCVLHDPAGAIFGLFEQAAR